MMKKLMMAMVGLAAMAVQAQTFSSTSFRVDTRQNAGIRTAADSETIYASSLWQNGYSAASCVATVTHTPPGGSVEQLYSTSTAGIEGFVWDAKKAAAGDHLFTHTIRARTGLTFDLPTEAQWEYACRAGTTTALNSGKNLTSTSSDANMAEVGRYAYNLGYISTCDGKGNTTYAHAEVGAYLPNNWGLYDMHGNVWEWCLDWYVSRGTSGFDAGAVTDPKGASSGSYRVFRGGSWYYYASYCRSADRYSNNPSGSYYDLGFRLSMTLP